MTDTSATEGAIEAPRSQWRDIWDQFRTHKGAMVGLFVLGFMVLFVLVGPFVWTKPPMGVDPDPVKMMLGRNLPPSWEDPLGTDSVSLDLLARMMLGGKVSLAVGLVAMLVAVFLGTFIGVLAGYFRRLDGPLMRLTDLFLSLPLLPLLLVITFLYGPWVKGHLGEVMGSFTLIV